MSNNSVQSMTKKLLLPLGALIVGSSFIFGASQALAGGFSRSCGNIRVESGRFLYATCRDRSANYRQSSLDLNSRIANKDGHLTRGGGYLSTCKNIAWDGGTSLRADCRTYNGDWRATGLDLNSVISNNDGNLTFDR